MKDDVCFGDITDGFIYFVLQAYPTDRIEHIYPLYRKYLYENNISFKEGYTLTLIDAAEYAKRASPSIQEIILDNLNTSWMP